MWRPTARPWRRTPAAACWTAGRLAARVGADQLWKPSRRPPRPHCKVSARVLMAPACGGFAAADLPEPRSTIEKVYQRCPRPPLPTAVPADRQKLACGSQKLTAGPEMQNRRASKCRADQNAMEGAGVGPDGFPAGRQRSAKPPWRAGRACKRGPARGSALRILQGTLWLWHHTSCLVTKALHPSRVLRCMNLLCRRPGGTPKRCPASCFRAGPSNLQSTPGLPSMINDGAQPCTHPAWTATGRRDQRCSCAPLSLQLRIPPV